MNTPRRGSLAKACTEVSTPERTRKVPSSEKEKARMARKIVHTFSASRFSITADRVEEGGAGEPRHQRSVLDRVPEPEAAPAERVIGPVGAHRDAERQEAPGDQRERPTKRAQAASMRPSISAAAAKEKTIEKPT